MVEATIQQIFLIYYAAYEKRHRLPSYIRYAAKCLSACRTRVLGGHVQSCPDGHFHRVWYNSCKHRMCPLCAFIQVERWLQKQKSRLIGCDHFHVIFTISDELHDLWRLNVTAMSRILFASARETLAELLKDKKYLGADPGIIASLHTWSRTLSLHPHLHCLVTAGGITPDKQWQAVKRNYLLPFRVVRKLFRGKFIAAIRKAHHQGELKLPKGMRSTQLENLLNKLGRKKWNVHLKETYSHGEGVLTYLARYLRGGPISNRRLLRCENGQVVLNRGREKIETVSLSIDAFIGRYLQHVPPPHAVRIRYYGLYHHTGKQDLEICRMLMGQPAPEEPVFLDWQSCCESRGEMHPERCPVCGKRLVVTESFRRIWHGKSNAMPPPASEGLNLAG